MGDSLKDQLKNLRRSGELKVSSAPEDLKRHASGSNGEKARSQATGNRASKQGQNKKRAAPTPMKSKGNATAEARQIAEIQQGLQSIYRPNPKTPKSAQPAETVTNAPKQWANWTATVGASACISKSLQEALGPPRFDYLEQPPIRSIDVGENNGEADLRLGLDFGTSTVKVVISDQDSADSFAVPFASAPGIARYLLPSAISSEGGRFSIAAPSKNERDLKCYLLANLHDKIAQFRVLALWALVIRHSLRWFLDTHPGYARKRLHWRLLIGIPAEHEVDPSQKNIFERLGYAAWSLAVADASDITPDVLARSLEGGSPPTRRPGDQFERVEVLPELAAQMYGLTAVNFDPNSPNNTFLILDVGAGTIDTSLFHVDRKLGRYHFTLFTSEVAPNGVSNLNAFRVGWWSERLKAGGAPDALVRDLATFRFLSDMQQGIPEGYEGYLESVDLDRHDSPALSPDEYFFRKHVDGLGRRAMNAGKKAGFFDAAKGQLAGLPLLICGGGTRMQFFKRLAEELKTPQPNTPYQFCVHTKVPPLRQLRAPGIDAEDHDRLSVAYGLSRIEFGKTVWATPTPPDGRAIDFGDRYVSKDFC